MQKMKITISKTGEVNIEVMGGRGDSCLEFTRELEKRLGTQVGQRRRKETNGECLEQEFEYETI